LIGVPNKNT